MVTATGKSHVGQVFVVKLSHQNCTDQELVEWLLALEFDKGMLASQAIAAAITVKAIICRVSNPLFVYDGS